MGVEMLAPFLPYILSGLALLAAYFFGYRHAATNSKVDDLEAKISVESALKKAKSEEVKIQTQTQKTLEDTNAQKNASPDAFVDYANSLLDQIFPPKR